MLRNCDQCGQPLEEWEAGTCEGCHVTDADKIGDKTMKTPSRAAILTLDELQSQFEKLKAKAESFVITGDLDRARAVARQALRARDAAEHFANVEGLR